MMITSVQVLRIPIFLLLPGGLEAHARVQVVLWLHSHDGVIE